MKPLVFIILGLLTLSPNQGYCVVATRQAPQQQYVQPTSSGEQGAETAMQKDKRSKKMSRLSKETGAGGILLVHTLLALLALIAGIAAFASLAICLTPCPGNGVFAILLLLLGAGLAFLIFRSGLKKYRKLKEGQRR
jgi:hypothetical protein